MLIKSANIDSCQKIHSSKLLTGIAFIAFSVASVSIIMLRNYPFLLICIPILVIHFYQILFSNCLRLSKNAIISCQKLTNDKWQLTNRVGKSFIVKKIKKAYRCPWFVILTFVQIRTLRKMTVIIAYDSLPKQSYTRLVSSLWNQ